MANKIAFRMPTVRNARRFGAEASVAALESAKSLLIRDGGLDVPYTLRNLREEVAKLQQTVDGLFRRSVQRQARPQGRDRRAWASTLSSLASDISELANELGQCDLSDLGKEDVCTLYAGTPATPASAMLALRPNRSGWMLCGIPGDQWQNNWIVKTSIGPKLSSWPCCQCKLSGT